MALAILILFCAGTASAQSLFTTQTPEFTQNVKTVLFPFNVYNRVENPDVLMADADLVEAASRCTLLASGTGG